jgi:signal peptidase I
LVYGQWSLFAGFLIKLVSKQYYAVAKDPRNRWGGLLAIWTILRITGMLQFYTVPTGSNEPTIPTGSYIFASNLVAPKRGDFICYKYRSPGARPDIWTKRLCGMPGDTLQIKEGVLYINGKNADEGRNLKFTYKISRNVYGLKLPPEDYLASWDLHDSMLVRLDVERAKRLHGEMQLNSMGSEPLGYSKYDQTWTVDFFGPYVVPQGHYFVMGDSRHNSMDSRFTGPVAQEDVVGVVLGK